MKCDKCGKNVDQLFNLNGQRFCKQCYKCESLLVNVPSKKIVTPVKKSDPKDVVKREDLYGFEADFHAIDYEIDQLRADNNYLKQQIDQLSYAMDFLMELHQNFDENHEIDKVKKSKELDL